MGKVDIDLANSHSNDAHNRPGEIINRLGGEDAIGFQRNSRPGQYLGNSRGQRNEAPFFSRKILGQSVKAQDERKIVLIKKPQNSIVQEAPVRRKGISNLLGVLLIHAFRIFNGPFERIECEKRLAAIVVNNASGSEKRIEKVDCSCESREFQELVSLRLVTIGAMIVA